MNGHEVTMVSSAPANGAVYRCADGHRRRPRSVRRAASNNHVEHLRPDRGSGAAIGRERRAHRPRRPDGRRDVSSSRK